MSTSHYWEVNICSLRYSQEPPIPVASHILQLHVPISYSFQALLNTITLPFHPGLDLLRSLLLLVLGPTLSSHPVSNYAKAFRLFQKLSHCSKKKKISEFYIMHFTENTFQMNRKYSWNFKTASPRVPWIVRRFLFKRYLDLKLFPINLKCSVS